MSRAAQESDITLLGPLAVALVLALALSGCTGSAASRAGGSPSTSPAVPTSELDASVAQFRFDEGTANLKAGVTNNSDVPIRVSSGTIAWDGFAFPTVPIPDPDALPGQTAAFTIAYGEPSCDRPPIGKPTLVAVVDGRTTRLPLRVEDPGLLDRLHAKACAAQRLDDNADVRLVLGTRTVFVRGEEYLPGTVAVRRRADATEPVTVVDLGGSVLVDVLPRTKGDLPARNRSVPVLLGSAHRCDAHARGQSSQTFLLSAYLRVARDATQRRIFIPSVPEQERLLALIDRDCKGA